MRKVLLSLLFSCIGIYAIGQNGLTPPGKYMIPVNPDQTKAALGAGNNPYTGWYDVINDAQTTGFASYSLYNGTLFPDSTVQVLFGNGAGGTQLGYNWTEGQGEILDPTSQTYVTPLSYFNDYSVDSIALFYLYNYVKEKDTLSSDGFTHDTLIFQFFSVGTGGISESTLAANAASGFPQELYGQVKYDYTKNYGVYPIGQTTYILGQSDTQSTVKNAIQMAVGTGSGKSFVPGAKLISKNNSKGDNTDAFAFTVSYRPGYKYAKGDTIDEKQSPQPKHLHSHFRTLVGQTSGTKASNSDYEMSLSVVSPERYNLSTYRGNSWPTGAYVGGSAWNTFNQVLWSAFHITTPNLGVQNAADPKGYLLGEVYPNPAKGSARIDFSLGNSENVTINVYDILGHKVATLANGTYTSGSHTINFNTSDLKEGVYIYNITAGSFTKTLKFTVAE